MGNELTVWHFCPFAYIRAAAACCICSRGEEDPVHYDFGSTAKILAKRVLEYYRTSDCCMQVVLGTGEKLYQDAKKCSDGTMVAGDWQR